MFLHCNVNAYFMMIFKSLIIHQTIVIQLKKKETKPKKKKSSRINLIGLTYKYNIFMYVSHNNLENIETKVKIEMIVT